MRNFMSTVVIYVIMSIILFTFMTIISLPALPFLLGKSNNLNCHRIEIHYAQCRQYRAHLYGLFKEQSVSIAVTGAAIKTYEIEGDGSTSTGYKIFIDTKKGNVEFFDYSTDESKAEQDIQQINQFLDREGKTSLNLKANNSFWGEVVLIPVGFAYTMFGFFVLIFGVGFLFSLINR